MRVSSTRDSMLNFEKICRRWKSMVWRERYRRAAISPFVSPPATSSAMPSWAALRLSHPKLSRRTRFLLRTDGAASRCTNAPTGPPARRVEDGRGQDRQFADGPHEGLAAARDERQLFLDF